LTSLTSIPKTFYTYFVAFLATKTFLFFIFFGCKSIKESIAKKQNREPHPWNPRGREETKRKNQLSNWPLADPSDSHIPP
jgi:Na+/H+ antiporter NhaC